MDSLPDNGVLVYELPIEFETDIAYFFKRRSKRRPTVERHEQGLKLFFEDSTIVQEVMRMGKIPVNGVYYSLYPLVTNLTIHKIASTVTEPAVWKYLKKRYSFKFRMHHSSDNHNDLRIILDVPEVQIIGQLSPVKLPTIKESFHITLFCRLCRKNGHKQYQCERSNRSIEESGTFEGYNRDGDAFTGSHSGDEYSIITRSKSNSPYTSVPTSEHISLRTPEAHGKNPGYVSPNLPFISQSAFGGSNFLQSSSPVNRGSISNTTSHEEHQETGIILGQGVQRVIAEVQGVLRPKDLKKFLRKVWRKKKRLDVVKTFNIKYRALLTQLKKVTMRCRECKLHEKREEKDGLRWIERLYTNLKRDISLKMKKDKI